MSKKLLCLLFSLFCIVTVNTSSARRNRGVSNRSIGRKLRRSNCYNQTINKERKTMRCFRKKDGCCQGQRGGRNRRNQKNCSGFERPQDGSGPNPSCPLKTETDSNRTLKRDGTGPFRDGQGPRCTNLGPRENCPKKTDL